MRIFWVICEKPERVGGALCGGGPTLLNRPAGFSIRKALGEFENYFLKITIRRTPIIAFFFNWSKFFPNIMVIFKNKLRTGGGGDAYYWLFRNISGNIDFRCGDMKYGYFFLFFLHFMVPVWKIAKIVHSSCSFFIVLKPIVTSGKPSGNHRQA